jgi:hypothetical protein
MKAKPFFKTRFVLRPSPEADGDHWLGGSGDYRGAECPVCNVPLLLLCDFNCDDPMLRKAHRGKLNALRRLPLFHCFQCFSELSYIVDERQKVRIVQTRYGQSGNGPPYDGFPDFLPRKPIRLDTLVPPGLVQAIQKWTADDDDVAGDNLSKSQRRVLEDYFGHPMFIPRFMYHHQLGGESLLPNWDDDAFTCPNKKCPGGLFDKVLKRGRPMKFLAGIINDPPGGFPLMEPLNKDTEKNWNFFGSTYYQICDKCLTITTFAASD